MGIWAITEGEYSDYKVLGTFEDKALAEAVHHEGMGQDVAEFPHFTRDDPPTRIVSWRLVAHVRQSDYELIRLYDPCPSVKWVPQSEALREQRPDIEVVEPKSAGNIVLVYVSARTKDGSLKALHDKLAQLRAEHHGL